MPLTNTRAMNRFWQREDTIVLGDHPAARGYRKVTKSRVNFETSLFVPKIASHRHKTD